MILAMNMTGAAQLIASGILLVGFVILGLMFLRLRNLRNRANLVYPRGFAQLSKVNKKRQTNQLAHKGYFPPEDVDLAALAQSPAQNDIPEGVSNKERDLIKEFTAYSGLALLNAKCIVSLRRNKPPDAALNLFFRIWTEQAEVLAAELPARWLISSALTFHDFGRTEAQRQAGLAIFLTTGFMKLYESEHLAYGHTSSLVPSMRNRVFSNIFLDLKPYKIANGDLDQNIMVRLHDIALADPVTYPLILELLNRINASDKTLFHRFRLTRERWAFNKKTSARKETKPKEAPSSRD